MNILTIAIVLGISTLITVGLTVLIVERRIARHLAQNRVDANSSDAELSQRILSEQTAQNADLHIKLERRIAQALREQREDVMRDINSAQSKHEGALEKVADHLAENRLQQHRSISALARALHRSLTDHTQKIDRRARSFERSQRQAQDERAQLANQALSNSLEKTIAQLSGTVEDRLQAISSRVDERLDTSFSRTENTFANVLKRLAIIDEAQHRIAALSENVVGLQEILNDKRARGAFGEVQLSALLRDALPEAVFELQHRLPNDKVVDCALMLPPPTGLVCIDSKFPLEAYRRSTAHMLPGSEISLAQRQFKEDVRRHIRAIAAKYIIPGHTSDGAIMFVPSESIFAEIQSQHDELVEYAHRNRVWLVSPTTLMAVLNTARAVLKDKDTREQVDLLRIHLTELGKEFSLFRARMQALSKRIGQAKADVDKVNATAEQITEQFERIERVEIEAPVNADAIEQSDRASGSAEQHQHGAPSALDAKL